MRVTSVNHEVNWVFCTSNRKQISLSEILKNNMIFLYQIISFFLIKYIKLFDLLSWFILETLMLKIRRWAGFEPNGPSNKTTDNWRIFVTWGMVHLSKYKPKILILFEPNSPSNKTTPSSELVNHELLSRENIFSLLGLLRKNPERERENGSNRGICGSRQCGGHNHQNRAQVSKDREPTQTVTIFHPTFLLDLL